MLTEPAVPPTEPAVIELRQYTLHSNRRDELIELFDREFVETQERPALSSSASSETSKILTDSCGCAGSRT
jgi:hypothetical protein